MARTGRRANRADIDRMIYCGLLFSRVDAALSLRQTPCLACS